MSGYLPPMGLELKGSVEEFQALVRSWQDRDETHQDIEFMLSRGGDDWLCNTLLTHSIHGISDKSIDKRIERFGSNRRKRMKTESWWSFFFEALSETTLIILMFCAVISIVINVIFAPPEEKSVAWVEGFAILVAVLVCSLVASTNDYKKSLKFNELFEEEQAKKEVELVRNGKRLVTHPEEIVVGDLVLLRSGMEIYGDGVVVESNCVEVDESSMTGESEPQRKEILRRCIIEHEKHLAHDPNSTVKRDFPVPSVVLLAGTKVVAGEGRYVVINVGANSAIGSIKSLVAAGDEATPLQEKLETLADRIGKFGLFMAILTLLALMIRLIIDIMTKGGWKPSKHPEEIVRAIIIAITIVVVAIPEGLPLAVTLSLAYSVQEMLKENNLVRRLNACETMGGADCICSDKTGTLTQNEMYLMEMFNWESTIQVRSGTEEIKTKLKDLIPNTESRNLFLTSLVANSSGDSKSIRGSKTEQALLKFLERQNVDMAGLRAALKIDQKFPFSSNRKRASVVVELEDGHYRVYVQGAVELLIESSVNRFDFAEAQVMPITPEVRKVLLEEVSNMANKALRVIATAYRDFESLEALQAHKIDEDGTGVYPFENQDLTLVCMFGIMDILRDGVDVSVRQCQRAGITVRMVTGDNKLTAVAIARNCGILNSQSVINQAVMEGREFMEKIEGVVCSYCRTHKCGCALNSTSTDDEDSSQGTTKDTKTVKESISEPEQSKKADRYKSRPESIMKAPKYIQINAPGTADGSGGDSPQDKGMTFDPPAAAGTLLPTRGSKQKKSVSVSFKEQNEIFESSLKAPIKKMSLPDGSTIDEKGKRRVRVDTIKNKKEFEKIVPNLLVLARSRPQDKYALVLGLKEMGHVVAVTGDGTNDAPALAKADVGFAMGLSGTDIAKSAADVIITNDNFNSIVSAVVRGRNIYDSIRKFLMFQLTVNVVAVVGTFVSAIWLNHPIITAVQMLWINLIMDTLASLALATEPPIAKDLLKRKPHPKNSSIISKKMLKHVLGQSLLQLGVIFLSITGKALFPEVTYTLIDKGKFAVTTEEDYSRDASYHSTYIFNIFVWLQIFNFLNCRRLNDEFNIFKALIKARYFIIIWVLIICLQVLIVNLGGKAFGIAQWGIGLRGWITCILIGALSLPMNMLIKVFKEEHLFALCWKATEAPPNNGSEIESTSELAALAKEEPARQEEKEATEDSEGSPFKKSKTLRAVKQ